MIHNQIAAYTQALCCGDMPDCSPDELSDVVEQMVLDASKNLQISSIHNALKVLNNARLFTLSKKLADCWRVQHGFDLVVEKRRVQALIELGELDEAEQSVKQAIQQAKALTSAQASCELNEYYGQLGRIAKQRFVQSDNLDQLDAAIKSYAECYHNSGKPYFHGINIVALVAAMSRRHNALQIAEEIQLPALAEKVLADVRARMANDDANWLLATASEACLALGRCDEAELWLHRYLLHPQTQAFHIESYSRQLREIWQGNALRNSSDADRLSAIVDKYAMRTQQKWSISPAMVKTALADTQSLEKNFSGERTFTVEIIHKMLENCAGIGCVTDKAGNRLGTGFLVMAAQLGLQNVGAMVFITNAHVVSNTEVNAIKPEEAWVTFELESAAKNKPIFHQVAPTILFSSPPGSLGMAEETHLDVSVLTLKSWPDGGLALEINEDLPIPSPKSKVFVVGHAAGSVLQLSLHDSQLLDVCDRQQLLHYRTPTEPGSSGSPVFNTAWQVVALHHAGSQRTQRLHGQGSYEANEGISIRAIRAAIVRQHQKS